MATDFRTSDDLFPTPDKSVSADPHLFRYGLRKLLIVFGITTVLIATAATSDGLTGAVVVLAALVVTLHLLSTAIGTQLRSRTDRQIESHSLEQPICVTYAESPSIRQQVRSPWHCHRGTPLPWLYRLIAMAVIGGGTLGIVLLSGLIGHRSSPIGIAVGSISVAVLGGWIAFIGYSFYSVFRDGVRDAMANDRRDQER